MFLTSKSKHVLNVGHHLTICFPLWMTVCSLIAKKCSNEASTSENTLRSLLCPEKKKVSCHKSMICAVTSAVPLTSDSHSCVLTVEVLSRHFVH